MFDVFTFSAVVKELKEVLQGEVVRKINQPSPNEILLSFNRSSVYGFLLLSCNPSMARFHLTGHKHVQQQHPPSFCMVLRKYIEGAVITGFSRPPLERVLEILFQRGINSYKLVVEIMGRHSNLILVDEENKIRGALKMITPDMSKERVVLPGKTYSPPPAQKKTSLEGLGRDEFTAVLSEMTCRDDFSWKHALVSSFQGISPLIAEETEFRALQKARPEDKTGVIAEMWETLQELLKKYNNEDFSPVVAENYGGKNIYSVFDLHIFDGYSKHTYESTCELLDYYYTDKQLHEKESQLRHSLAAVIEKEIKKVNIKEQRQREDLKTAREAERYRHYGELIFAHITHISGKNNHVELPDIYHPRQKTVVIPMDERLSAKENAQKYFKKYRKLRKSESRLKVRLSQTLIEKEYLENVIYALENANLPLLEETYNELIQTGYIKRRASSAKQKDPPVAGALTFVSSSGHTIMVGRNNMQNEDITFRKASRNDTWFHVQKLAGSHVLVRGASFPPDDNTLLEAATLAAHFSKGKNLPVVTVDYTLVKHVKRAPGGKPGMAIYKNFNSISVPPGGAVLEQLLGDKR